MKQSKGREAGRPGSREAGKRYRRVDTGYSFEYSRTLCDLIMNLRLCCPIFIVFVFVFFPGGLLPTWFKVLSSNVTSWGTSPLDLSASSSEPAKFCLCCLLMKPLP